MTTASLDPYLPWPGKPRRFYAVAMPNGDKRVDVRVDGELVFLKELRVGVQEPGCILTRAEAEQLRDELNTALRTFRVARVLASDDAPRAYLGPYPIRGATLADTGFIDEIEAA